MNKVMLKYISALVGFLGKIEKKRSKLCLFSV